MSKLSETLSFQEVAEILRVINAAPRDGEFEIELGDASLRFQVRGTRPQATGDTSERAEPVTAPAAPDPRPVPAPQQAAVSGKNDAAGQLSGGQEGWRAVESPLVGIFYRAPHPGVPPFVNEGDAVEEGQQVAIIEVMKLMNRIVAPCAGIVRQICVANEELAEFGQTLMWIEPTGEADAD